MEEINGERNIKIYDAHHHLWQFNTKDYGWMDDSMDILRKDYVPADLEKELSKAGVEGTVVVQARQNLEETEWLLELAEANSFIKGVVGWVDLRSDNLKEQLEKFGRHPKLVGVRHVIHDEPEDDFMLGDAFKRGIGMLKDYDLTYDLLLFPRHLPYVVELVSLFPEQPFVIDHISKPLIKDGILEPWKEDIQLISTYKNVFCKISGMVTEAEHKQWKEEDFYPYMDAVLAAFGTDRLMLGSDWPVCRLSGEYDEVFNIPLNYFKEFSEMDKERIFRKNCITFYNLQQ